VLARDGVDGLVGPVGLVAAFVHPQAHEVVCKLAMGK
jgi:hypothetical protein